MLHYLMTFSLLYENEFSYDMIRSGQRVHLIYTDDFTVYNNKSFSGYLGEI